MEKVIPFAWQRLFLGNQDWLYYYEIMFRIIIVYIFAVLLLRLLGKHGRVNASPFQQVVIIALGSATGDVLFYPEVPIFYAFLTITIIVILSNILNYIKYAFVPLQNWLSGCPKVLVRNGVVINTALAKEKMPLDELHSLLRTAGWLNVKDVGLAILELDGTLSTFSKDEVRNNPNSVLYEEVE